MKHKHAELMLAYAQDAQKTDKPWLLWEFRYNDDKWLPLEDNPWWAYLVEYRRKIKTIRINGYDVPEPLKVKPNKGEKYYCVSFREESNVDDYPWNDDTVDNQLFSKGMVHLNYEAAELHASALISLTKS